jgi:hypothetical protein
MDHNELISHPNLSSITKQWKNKDKEEKERKQREKKKRKRKISIERTLYLKLINVMQFKNRNIL